jgi:hypothetical protein
MFSCSNNNSKRSKKKEGCLLKYLILIKEFNYSLCFFFHDKRHYISDKRYFPSSMPCQRIKWFEFHSKNFLKNCFLSFMYLPSFFFFSFLHFSLQRTITFALRPSTIVPCTLHLAPLLSPLTAHHSPLVPHPHPSRTATHRHSLHSVSFASVPPPIHCMWCVVRRGM